MSVTKKVLLVLLTLLTFSSCAGNSIFNPIPLTLNPLVLANPISLVASASNQRLYLVNSNNQVLWADSSFIILDISNPTSPQPVAVISIPNFSGQILLDETRGFVYIPNRQSSDKSDTVDQVLSININESSPDFLSVGIFDSGPNPFGGFFEAPDDLFVAATQEALHYNVNDFSGFTMVNLAVKTAQGNNINVENTRELALSPSGSFLFVTNQGGDMLILDTAQFPAPTAPGQTDLGTEAVDYAVTGPASTQGITHDSQFIYVVDSSPSLLRVMTEAGLVPVSGPPQEISAGSLQVAAIPIGSAPDEVIVDEANHRAYVSNTDSDDISVIDTNLFIEITRISVANNLPSNVAVGDGPFGMALVNLGGVNYLYVANFNSNNVTVIDVDTLAVVAAFP
jgi:YVTN family beta-propeller protein